MGGVYLESRLEFLRQTQNPDGGWGYFPGKQSWFEPTAYAMLALHGAPDSEKPLNLAWSLIRSWQCRDGSFRPCGRVPDGTWVTAHAVNLASIRGVYDDSTRRAVNWILGVVGAEHDFAMRAASRLHLLETKLDVSHEGWPWRDGNASWIEPTVHTLVALKKAAAHYPSSELTARVRDGEALLWTRRCADGGWNCGNPNVFDLDLPSYPETTGLALIGLQGWRGQPLDSPLDVAHRYRSQTKASLAKAWLAIALQCYGRPVDAPAEQPRTSNDILLAALESLAHPAGNHAFFRTGGLA